MKIIIGTIFLFITTLAFAQNQTKQNENVSSQHANPSTYRLFPTQNIWIFIKLNTRTGQLWQVQFNMKDESRFVSILSSEILVSKDKEMNDRFTLYPTQNMYTFILLDQVDGKTWQVQWSTEINKKFIIPIE